MNKSFVFTLAVTALCSLGCATTGDVRAAKQEALDSSAEAARKADEALTTAREARRLAQDAEARAARSEEMLNRGFKRAMYK